MSTIHTVLLVVQVLIGAMIIGLVLLQRGKGAEAGAAFGSGASGTVFGARGSANFLSRSTAVLAALFFVNCLGLAYLGTKKEAPKSILDTAGVVAPAPAGQAAADPATGGMPQLPPASPGGQGGGTAPAP